MTIAARLLLALLLAPIAALAHSLTPSLLHVHENSDGLVEITWTTPALVPAGAGMHPRVPDTCRPVSTPRIESQPSQYVARWIMRCKAGLIAQRFGAAGMGQTRTNTVLRVELADGRRFDKVLTEQAPSFVIPERASRADAAVDYAGMGIGHVLGGWDHLAFVLGLLLLARSRRSLVWTITAFTLGHSLTLALAATRVVQVPQEWTEAAIALSILIVAAQAARGREASWLARRPAFAAAAFGLLHGLGFAAALSDVGLPQLAMPLALASFNAGIELGQLLFVAGVLGAVAAWRRAHEGPVPRWVALAPSHGIGGLGAFWLLQRLAAAWA